jgi:hypothetical protein
MAPPNVSRAAVDRARLIANIQKAIEGEDAATALDALLDAVAHCIGIVSETDKIADILIRESSVKLRHGVAFNWRRLRVLRRAALAARKGKQ